MGAVMNARNVKEKNETFLSLVQKWEKISFVYVYL